MKVLQILVLILVFVVTENAQTSILSGTVYDANGAVIPETKITAINQKGEKFETLTNDEGFYFLDLPFTRYDSKLFFDFVMAKYEIIVDRENWGFEKFVLKDFRFVPSYKGKMNLDIALNSINPEPCGYSGADCLNTPVIKTTKAKISDKILQRPLEKFPKEQNKTKRKNKNNK
jgi:hypothetical protein